MKLIAGLGNPGTRYSRTRHNIGFFVIDALCARHGLKLRPGKGDWYEAEYEIGGEKIILIKPTTYMNNSGTAVKECMERNSVPNEDVLAIVDDFQIPLGTIRIRGRGSDGGHNGLASIAYELETEEYARLRLGIGREGNIRKDEYVDFVLGEFTEDEFELIGKMINIYADCAENFAVNGLASTMNSFNRSHLEEDKDSQNTEGS